MYNVRELVLKGKKYLRASGLPEIEARYIAEYILGISFTELINQYEDSISEEISNRFFEIVNKRIKRYPLQYITNEQMFYGINFYVDENVLIPRPETELLVDLGINYVKKLIEAGKQNIRIIDMCTGSGCIAISLASELTKINKEIHISIIAVDVSEKALKIAKRNWININLNDKFKNSKIEFVQSNLFENIKLQQVDLIISNPPYIPPREIEKLMPEVRSYEPNLALNGGNDGLDFYRSIACDSFENLNSSGMILFEIGHGQMKDVKEILSLNNYKGVCGQVDLQQYERIVYGIKLNKPD